MTTDTQIQKCKDCGLLAMREQETNLVLEAVDAVRQSGGYRNFGDFGPQHLFCYANHRNFPDLAREVSDSLNLEIDCDDFRQYQPGKSPKEHEHMSIKEQALALANQYRREDLRWRAWTLGVAVLALLVSVTSAAGMILSGILNMKR